MKVQWQVRLDRVFQGVVGSSPLVLLVPILVDRLVDDNEQGVGQPGVESRPCAFPVSSPNAHGAT